MFQNAFEAERVGGDCVFAFTGVILMNSQKSKADTRPPYVICSVVVLTGNQVAGNMHLWILLVQN